MFLQVGGNGRIYDGTIYGSTDGENWEVLSQKTGLTYSYQANTNEQAIALTKNFEVEEPKEALYIKIVADRTNGNWFTAREFNLYEDLTINPRPTAGIGFSTTELTNENVVARLINPSTEIRVTNTEGVTEVIENGETTYTHVFEKNGEFTFTFVDSERKRRNSYSKSRLD